MNSGHAYQIDEATLRTVHLAPYRAAVDAGAQSNLLPASRLAAHNRVQVVLG